MSRQIFAARVAVIIKALNEEKNIARCVESALVAANSVSGIVVLADSGSSDRTIEIAGRYPILIVQLADTSERCCGIGAQLGYQFVDSEYVYVLDGDMELDAEFLKFGIDFLEKNNQHAGVAGLVDERGGGNYEFEARKALSDGRNLGLQTSLDMGGLYRVKMIRAAGYLTNRNLHSYEEKELGLRLMSAGYLLERASVPAVRHFGKTEGSMNLLGRRWKSRHIDGPGEWLRSALGTRHFWVVFRMFKQLWLVVLSWILLMAGVLLLPLGWIPLAGAWAVQLFFLAYFVFKNKSIDYGFVGFLNIHISSAGMVRGFFSAGRNPTEYIDSVCLRRIL